MQSIDWRYCTLWDICLPLAKPFLDESIIFTETGTVFSIEKKIVPISIVTVAKIQTFIRWYFCILSVQCSQIFFEFTFLSHFATKSVQTVPNKSALIISNVGKKRCFFLCLYQKAFQFSTKNFIERNLWNISALVDEWFLCTDRRRLMRTRAKICF